MTNQRLAEIRRSRRTESLRLGPTRSAAEAATQGGYHDRGRRVLERKLCGARAARGSAVRRLERLSDVLSPPPKTAEPEARNARLLRRRARCFVDAESERRVNASCSEAFPPKLVWFSMTLRRFRAIDSPPSVSRAGKPCQRLLAEFGLNTCGDMLGPPRGRRCVRTAPGLAVVGWYVSVASGGARHS
jgi:hypothetical protein